MSTPTPLLDLIKRGQAAQDVRLLAAQGTLAPRAHEQLAILIHLLDDPDPAVRCAADETLHRIPVNTLQAHLARADVPPGVREFFAARGISPADLPAAGAEDPLVTAGDGSAGDLPDGDGAASGDDRENLVQRIARMSFTERLKAAMKGSREMRAILIRDPNKAVATAVLSSPKVNEAEVEAFARMANVAEDVLRIIGSHRVWMRNYGILAGLTRNPKTPVALSLNLMGRLNGRDLAMLSVDRNVPEPLRVAARRRVVEAASSRK